jgi:hypothetical protein
MVLESLAVLSGLKSVFMYNRQSYQFNKELDQERLYHLQKMRIEQVELYRDDIRDLFNLVVTKMNNYYLVNTLALGFSLGFFYEGKVPADCPSWMFWMWAVSIGSSMMYLFLSVWFAVHASVVAQMFSARLLTQWLRLPVPGPDQIDAGAPKLEEFEKAPAKQILRMPVISSKIKSQKDVVVGDSREGSAGGGSSSSADPVHSAPKSTRPLDPPTTHDPLMQEGYNFYMGHFYMYARLQKHWTSLDAYCRVCMVVGCNQVLNAITYTALAYFALSENQWGFISFVVIPVVFGAIHTHMNLILSRLELIILVIFNSLGPLLAGTAAAIQMVLTNENMAETGASIAQGIAVAAYTAHLVSFLLIFRLGLELHEEGELPTRFAAVNYIDILGINKNRAEEKAALPSDGLMRKFSQRLSGFLSDPGSESPQEPPISDAVPAASSMRKAGVMYEKLVRKEKTRHSTSYIRAGSSEENVGSMIIPDQVPAEQSDGTVLVSQLPYASEFLDSSTPNGKLRRIRSQPTLQQLMEEQMEQSVFKKRTLRHASQSFVTHGPEDYAPTVAQLQSPDILARMPFVSFKVLGITVIGLWVAGIVFSIISVTGSIDIGWVNKIAPSATLSSATSFTALDERRLLENESHFHIPPPAKFLKIDNFFCGGSFIKISDKSSDRQFQVPVAIDSAEDSLFAAPTISRMSEHEFVIGDVTYAIPSDFHARNMHSSYIDKERVLITVRDGILHWDTRSGDFVGQLGHVCSVPREIVGLCPSSGKAAIIYRRGDLCLI